jgi:hypothetical protein
VANFLFGLAGAAIGSAFGMPALGFALGSGVGAVVSGHHHNPAPHFAEMRLNDLKVQTSTYGIGIPRLYGCYRIAGNVIWATDILEVKDASDHYSYYGNFAIGLCAGSIGGIRRLWADGKEIFKIESKDTRSLRTHYPKGIRLYRGDETQLPDPLLEAHQGKGQVPGFRGLAYLVFENFPLANFNNRLPNIAVEVVQSAAELPLEPADNAPEHITHDKVITQKGISYHVKTDRYIKPASENTNKLLPSALPLSVVVQDVFRQIGITSEQVDVALLKDTITGFILSQPTSLREIISLLQQAYGFDVVESDTQFKCIPRGITPSIPISKQELAREEAEEGGCQVIITSLPNADLPQAVTLFFTNAKDYAVSTQTAARQGIGQKHHLELPLVLSPEEALSIAERSLEEAWRNRRQLNFSLPRSYAMLEPSDRLLLDNQILRIENLAYGSPGLVKIKAVAEA